MKSQPVVFALDPNDPRAPSEEIWARMSLDERRSVVDMLPAEVPLGIFQPEGDPHRTSKSRALDALDSFFRKMGRRVYLSNDLAVYYPNEPMFAPDLFAVVDVEIHERMKWVVSDEGKGLDFVLEVHVAGDRKKDFEQNVERYARLGIPEYFIYDFPHKSIRGYRLPPGGRVYKPILPQVGRWSSQVLGLEILLEGKKLRFYAGEMPLLEADELVMRLDKMLDEVVQQHIAAETRALDAEMMAEQERMRVEDEKRRAEDEKRRADEAEARLAEALAELKRMRES